MSDPLTTAEEGAKEPGQTKIRRLQMLVRHAQGLAAAAESRAASAEAEIERLRDRVAATLNDACRMSAILLMAGEMTAQERRTARAVAEGLANKVRAALTGGSHE